MFAPELGNFPHFHLTDMSSYRKFINKLFTSILLLFFVASTAFAQDGEALFKANCASCHKVDVDFA
jgi:cytochrome c2